MDEPDGRLLVERRGDALLVGLDRPAKLNALDEQTVAAFHGVLAQASLEACVLVVHSTTPGVFAAGADIAELRERAADDALRAINAGLFARLAAHRWPTIAVVDGAALGGGCELAMACDLRLASPRAVFGQPELALGILAGAGANARLPQLVGLSQARRMLYLGEQLDAERALRAGLVDAVHEPDEVLDAALAMAGQIARRSWRALELTKLSLRSTAPDTTLFDVTAQALLFDSEDKRERMTRFLDRRSGRGGTPATPAEPPLPPA